MSCSEHNTTDCLICAQMKSFCVHGLQSYCAICGPATVFGKAADVAAKANGCSCYMCAPQAATLGRDTIELARTRIAGLEEAVKALTTRASMLVDELGAMRSDRDEANRQLISMRKAFEIQSRQLAKLQGIKTR